MTASDRIWADEAATEINTVMAGACCIEYTRRDTTALAADPLVQAMMKAAVKTALEKVVDIAMNIAESCAGNAEVYSPPFAGANEELRLLHTGGEQVCYQFANAIQELIDQPKGACDNG